METKLGPYALLFVLLALAMPCFIIAWEGYGLAAGVFGALICLPVTGPLAMAAVGLVMAVNELWRG